MRCVKPKLAQIEVDDLLLEIFLRLPSNSIQRFEAVNKHWQTLITNPTFRKQWRKRNLKLSSGLFLHNLESGKVELVPFSSKKPIPSSYLKPELKIMQSCNGLLLCRSTPTDNLSNLTYYVYNPTTDACHTLPEVCHIHPAERVLSMSLAFDPNKSSSYKVICFTNYYGILHVYSSDTRNWKPYNKITCNVNPTVVYWNGAIHWLQGFSYFHIENMISEKLPQLPDCSNWSLGDYFGESCDSLNYAKIHKSKSRKKSCVVDVYELKRDYSEWVLKYHVELDYPYSKTSVLSVVHGVEEKDSFLVLKTNERIVRYNLISNTSEVLPTSKGYFDGDFAFHYIESQFDV